MADVDYTLHYRCDATDLLAKNQQVIASLQAVDALLVQVKTLAGTLYSGSGQTAAAATRQANQLATALQNVATQATGANTALNGINVTVPKVSKSIAGLASAMVVLSEVRSALNAIAEESEKVQKHWEKMAEDVTKFRERLRELASLRGENGPNNTVMADVNALAIGIGVAPDEAAKFAVAYENFGQTVREQGHFQPAQGSKEKLEADILAMTGRVARARGLGMKEAGALAGTLGLFNTYHNVDEAANVLGGTVWGINMGSTTISAGVSALNKTMAKLVDPEEAAAEGARPGRIRSSDEAGVYFGVASMGTGGRADPAGHRMVQISRLFNPDTTTDKGRTAAAALAAAGITDEMDDIEKVIQMNKFLRANNHDPAKWLQDNRLGSQATREGLVAVMKNADTLESRIATVRKGGFGREELQRTAQFFRTDRAADAGRVGAVASVIDNVQGESKEWHQRALEAADQRRRLFDPYYNSAFGNAVGLTTWPLSRLLGGEDPTTYHNEYHLDYGAMTTLRAAAKKAGVNLKRFPGLNAWDVPTRAKAFGEAAEEIKARGVDPLNLAPIEAEVRRRNDQMRGTDFSRHGVDPKLLNATQQQTDQIKGLRQDMRHLLGAPAAPAPVAGRSLLGPLRVDAPDGGPGRAGP